MLIRLSQAQLNLLETCPRKFQQVYLDQLGTPIASEQQDQMNWGSRFHLLMQQRELGLPLLTDTTDPLLQNSVDAFIQAAPELFQQQAVFRQSEHRRTLELEGYLLTVVYDLLILNPQQAQILDWKTYPLPQNQRWLAESWQTRLYPFVLAETSDYSPEDISITYWFVRATQSASETSDSEISNLKTSETKLQPQSLRFNYSTSQHQAIRSKLGGLLDQLTAWLKDYQAGTPFPQVEAAEDQCGFCTFDVRCQRHQPETPVSEELLTLAEIQEVAL
ncbi:PD-(D/E)XK nuclease family protein [Leptolyngbya sp. FACHB-671]|uniref:PD-(D/E)XK nuclease family protein n=1 Tax=Leptolyngbya sp. FACHB-671 TaxID=2692812 RepID=UPI0016895A33|nr:PD-(D/E)XK nuclease family protein [Leptolyngbya sp. FACHB-671]MBD2068287.1 PD-(D/E)XK nuclease family protein [Leptolyngbya sp. FACHB-671]